jgi:hypothetical protein
MNPSIQQLDQKYGVGAPQSSQGQPTNTAIGTSQGISDALRSLGLGEIPMVGSAAYEGIRGARSALGNKDAFQSNSDPFYTDKQLGAFSDPVSAGTEAGKNIAGAESWAVGGLNPIGMSDKAMAARAGIGALSGLGQNISQGRGKNTTSDVLSALIGAGTNVYAPPALGWLGGKVGQVAFGKAGEKIPQIAQETGQVITGSGSQGAKQAAANIGQKIGDLYDQMNTGMTKNEFFNLVNDTTAQDTYGNVMPSNLDNFMKEAGIAAENKPQVLNFLKTMAVGSKMRGNLAARANQSASGTVEKEFNAALSNYLSKAPDVSAQLGQKAPTLGTDLFKKQLSYFATANPTVLQALQKKFGQNLENITPKAATKLRADVASFVGNNPAIQTAIEGTVHNNEVAIPGGFWQDFKSAIKPSQKVFDQIKKNPDYQMTTEDKIRMQLSEAVAKQLQTKLAAEYPDALPQIQQLNKLYGAAIPLAKGTTQSILPRHLQIMSQLMGAGLMVAPLTGMKMSPYFQLIGALGMLANPTISGTVASQVATPGVNSVVNALSSLGASGLAKKVAH